MKSIDLVTWTMQEAQQLRPEHQMQREIDSSPSLDKLREVLHGEQKVKANLPRIGGLRLSQGTSADGPASEASGPLLDNVSAAPALVQAPGTEDVLAGPMSSLLKAVVEPDICTPPADRERAIRLRWALRDIKANRLKLSPIDQHDLRDLIDMGLVELRNDAPVLTNAGVSVIV
jgi:hypothetical protein